LFPEKKHRRAVAVDETKVKLENQWIYIWNAIDVDDRLYMSPQPEHLWMHMYFLRKILECCENESLILVDGGPWYKMDSAEIGIET